MYEFGYQLGIAFQITDDYLDTFGNEKVFGKKIGGDIVNNKKTWLLVECFRRATGEQKCQLEKLLQLGEDQREEKVEAVRDLYGVLIAAPLRAQTYTEQIEQTVDQQKRMVKDAEDSKKAIEKRCATRRSSESDSVVAVIRPPRCSEDQQ